MRVLAWPAFNAECTNPYNRLLYQNMVDIGTMVVDYSFLEACFSDYDIFHIHWPDYQLSKKSIINTLFRVMYLFLVLLIVKLNNAKIVWTIHNLSSHEKYHPLIEYVFWRIFIPTIDGYVCLTASGQETALNTFPKLKRISGAVIPHGHYREIYGNTMSEATARNILGLPHDAKVLLFFGAIRHYKNVCHLIRTFNKLIDCDAYLVVAGKPADSKLLSEIINLTSGNERIKLKLSFIPDSDVEMFMNASNLVVLPFTDILNSGSALLALSFNKPILVPLKGAMNELRVQVGGDYVYTYDQLLTVEALNDAIYLSMKRSDAIANLDKLNWDKIAYKSEIFFKRLLMSSL